jgi:hypothetical protein
MLKPVAVALPALLLATSASADTVTTSAETLVVVTPNAPVVVNTAGGAAPGARAQAPGADEMPPPYAAPAYPAPAAAPQNEDWSNLSHINGQLVPVGVKNDYMLKFRRTNIASNPIAWMFGWYQLSLSHGLTNNIAARFDVSGWSLDHNSGYQLGASAQIFFKRVHSGPYLEPGLIIRHEATNYDYAYAGDCYSCYDYNNSTTWTGTQVLFGWQWMFDSGFNVAAAVGAAKPFAARHDGYGYYDNDPIPAGYFRVGYAF